MKIKWKKYAVDAVLVVMSIFCFSNIDFGKLSHWFLAFFCVVASFVIHTMAWKLSGDETLEEDVNTLLTSDETELGKYMLKLRTLRKNDAHIIVIVDTFSAQLESFNMKSEALMSLIDINNGKAKEFLITRNNDVQAYFLKNLKKLLKHIIAYNAKTAGNRARNAEEEPVIKEIIQNNNDLLNLYDKLLDEVSRMGDDFNIQDPGLQSVIESLQELRVGTDESDDDSEEIQLHIPSSGKVNYH